MRITAGFVAIALAVLFVTQVIAAPAVDIRKALETAIFHSGELAQRGTAIAGTRTHLQHVINCLEGPNGKDFVQAVGFPCQGMGNGIVPDLQAAGSASAKSLQYAQIALTLALQAVTFNDVNAAQPWAKVISGQLTIALNALPK
ncbi:MAG TPA: hypothetical protein VGR24_04985 [bacterium]|jgi:hypothetical protein|nr:hypothetical protein [bacterium]